MEEEHKVAADERGVNGGFLVLFSAPSLGVHILFILPISVAKQRLEAPRRADPLTARADKFIRPFSRSWRISQNKTSELRTSSNYLLVYLLLFQRSYLGFLCTCSCFWKFHLWTIWQYNKLVCSPPWNLTKPPHFCHVFSYFVFKSTPNETICKTISSTSAANVVILPGVHCFLVNN